MCPRPNVMRNWWQLLGQVPYLNGGLFRRPRSGERDYPEITIPDEAFEKNIRLLRRLPVASRRPPPAQRQRDQPRRGLATFSKNTSTSSSRWAPITPRRTSPATLAATPSSPSFSTGRKRGAQSAFTSGGGVWRLLQDEPRWLLLRSRPSRHHL